MPFIPWDKIIEASATPEGQTIAWLLTTPEGRTVLQTHPSIPSLPSVKASSRFASVPKEGFSTQELVLLLIAVKLSKTPEGLKVLRDVAIQGIKTMGDTMEAIAKASVGNPVSAWANPYLLSIIFEKFGIVDSERMAEFRIGLSLISGAEVAEDVVKALSGFRMFSLGESRHQAEEFPTTIDFGDKYELQSPEKLTFVKADQKKK